MESISKIRGLLSESVWVGGPSTDVGGAPPPGSFLHMMIQLNQQWVDSILFSGLDAALGDLGLNPLNGDVPSSVHPTSHSSPPASLYVYQSRNLTFDLDVGKAEIGVSLDMQPFASATKDVVRVGERTYSKHGSAAVYCSWGSIYSHKTFSFDDYATTGDVVAKLAQEILDICKRLQVR